MGEPSNKRLKVAKEDGGSANSTPRKKSANVAPEINFLGYYKIFKEIPDTQDNFKVEKINFGVHKRPKDAKVVRIAKLENIPEMWTVKSLAKLYDTLYDIFGNKSHKPGEEIVKAIIEMALTFKCEILNQAFAPETFTGNKPAYEFSTADNSTPTKFPDTKGPREQLAKFIGQKTGSASGNFKSCYMQTLFWVTYDVDGNLPHYLIKHTAQAVLSWLTSYIILQAYGNHAFVTRVYKKPSLEDLKSVWKRDLGNVFAHYQRFFTHPISDCLEWSKKEFMQARFLPRNDEEKSDYKKNFNDEKELLEYFEAAADVEPGDLMKGLIEHVVAKAGKSAEENIFQENRVAESISCTSMQTKLLNLVKGQSVLDGLYKQRLEEDAQVLQEIRKRYIKYRAKENLPSSCTFPIFAAKVLASTDSLFEGFSDRPTANEEKYDGDYVRFREVERIEVVTKDVEVPLSEIEDYVNGNNRSHSIDYVEKVKKDAESQILDSDIPAVYQGVDPPLNDSTASCSISATSSKIGSDLGSSDTHLMDSEGNEIVSPKEPDPSKILEFGLTNFADLIKIPVVSNSVSNDNDVEEDRNLIKFEDGDNYGNLMDDLLSDM